jgi:hypothetical protein
MKTEINPLFLREIVQGSRREPVFKVAVVFAMAYPALMRPSRTSGALDVT